MKISVVVTVLNEQNSIQGLLKSLFSQKKKPNEVVIVDAGSKDNTLQILRDIKKKQSNLRIFIRPGINRSQARNIGIKKAKGPIIAVTDAGCIPKKDWLEKISKPFADKTIDVVSGFYQAKADSLLQKSLAVYTCVLPHQLDPNKFLPASRSIAFTKAIWKKAGGYPVEYDTCEDMIYVQKLKKSGANFTFAEDAIVYWKQHESWSKAFKQFFNYAKGDGEALYIPHLKRISLIWARYLIGLLILITFPLLLLFLIPQYIAWSIGKGYSFVKDKKAIIILPLLQITSDIAVISGSLVGLVIRVRKR